MSTKINFNCEITAAFVNKHVKPAHLGGLEISDPQTIANSEFVACIILHQHNHRALSILLQCYH